MKIEMVNLELLKHDPHNVREHDERNLSAIRHSLEHFGQQKPIVVDKQGVIIAGNGTFHAACSLGWQKIAVVRTALEGHKKTAFAIADNRSAELANWDESALADQLKSLRYDCDVYLATGFEDSEIDAILDMAHEDDALPDEINLQPIYQVIAQCNDDKDQQRVYELMQQEGITCRLLNL